jgi:hypothetical protein
VCAARGPRYRLVVLKVWRDGEVDLEQAAGDGLHVGLHLQLGEHVDHLVNRLAQLGRADQLANLVWVEVVQTLKRQVLLLQFAHDIVRHPLELPQR